MSVLFSSYARLTSRLVLPVAATLVGCSPSGGDGGSAGGSADGIAVTVEASELLSTSVSVTWTLEREAEVTFTLGDELDPAGQLVSIGAEDSAFLWGLTPNRDHVFNLTAREDGEVVATYEGTFTTGGVSSDLPDWTHENHIEEGESAEGFLSTSFLSEPCAAIILDTDGNARWWYVDDSPAHLITRVVPSIDGRSVLVGRHLKAWEDDPEDEWPDILRVDMAGEVLEEIDVPGFHHDFTELPDGTITYLASHWSEHDGEIVLGDAVVERSMDGTLTTIWTADDGYDYVPAEPYWEKTSASWTHANAIDYQPATDSYLVGLRNLSSIARVLRDGTLAWRWGGDQSDFDLLGDGRWPDVHHQFDLRDGRLVVFVNGEPDVLESRIDEFIVDEAELVTSQVWTYSPVPTPFIYVLGDVSYLPTGNLLAAWSTSGELNQLDPQGEIGWEVATDVGAGIGYTSFHAAFGGLELLSSR